MDSPDSPLLKPKKLLSDPQALDPIVVKPVQSLGHGEFAFSIVRELSQLLKYDLNLSDLGNLVTQVCCAATGAETGEFLLSVANQLELISDGKYCTLQNHIFDEDESNFPGYIAKSGKPMCITNAQTNALYTSFAQQLQPFKNRTVVTTHSVIAVPLFNSDSQLLAVIQLFNKQTETGAMSYFTDDDVFIIKAAGILIESIIQKHHQIAEHKRREELLRLLSERAWKSSQQVLKAVYSSNRVTVLQQLGERQPLLSSAVLREIAEIMQCDGALLHLTLNQQLNPFIKHNINTIDNENLRTKTADYVLRKRTLLNITDIRNDPLSQEVYNWNEEFQSVLVVPLINDKEVISVIELYRSDGIFTEHDENLLARIVKLLQHVPIESYVLNIPEEDRNPTIPAYKVAYVADQLAKQQTFSLTCEDNEANYLLLINNIKKTITSLVPIDNCTLYIADNAEKVLWSKKFERWDPVFANIDEETLIGTCASQQERLKGSGQDVQTPDARLYENQYYLLVPVISAISTRQTVGVIHCVRKSSAFTDGEVEQIAMASYQAQIALEQAFVSQKKSIDPMPPSPNARQPNINAAQQRRSSIRLVHIHSIEQTFRRRSTLKQTPDTTQTIFDMLAQKEESPESKIDLLDIPEIKSLVSMADLGPSQFDLISGMITRIADNQDDIMQILVDALWQVTQAEEIRIFILKETEGILYDVTNNSTYEPSGLIDRCLSLQRADTYYGPSLNPDYDDSIDSLDLPEINNLMVVPIQYSMKDCKGVIAMGNGKFQEEAQNLARFAALFCKAVFYEAVQVKKDKGRRIKMILHWCKQIFAASINAHTKQEIAMSVSYETSTAETFEKLLELSLQCITSICNTEGANLYFFSEKDNTLQIYSPEKQSFLDVEPDEQLSQVIATKTKISINRKGKFENLLMIPIIKHDRLYGVISAWNKKDDTNRYYVPFSQDGEIMISSMADCLSDALNAYSSSQEINIEGIKQMIRSLSSNMNSVSVLANIRRAAVVLTECDRATLFTRKGDKMTVQPQGLEQEIPVGLEIPIGVGIVGYVAETGQTENIKDCYSDERFNIDVDKQTGYKTNTMLTMPIKNAQNETIAAFQMINKNNGGIFTPEDESILEMFAEICSSAIHSGDIFAQAMEERTYLLSILSSIKNFIIVFDIEGQVHYCNQHISAIFGTDEAKAKSSHYRTWINSNPTLIQDLENVMANPSKRVLKKLQNLTHKNQKQPIDLVVNYQIMPLLDLSTQQLNGLVLIIEDVTDMQAMKKAVQDMESQIQSAAKTPQVTSNTPLQQCIDMIYQVAADDQTHKEELYDVVAILKAGNLDKPNVQFDTRAGKEITKYLNKEFINTKSSSLKRTSSDIFEEDLLQAAKNKKRAFTVFMMPQTDMFETIKLSQLRDWNINVFEIEDLFPYVYGMFKDYDLFSQFEIPLDGFRNFLEEIKTLYSKNGNPYHNWIHGFSVLQATYNLLCSTPAGDLFDVLDIFALLIASLCHDADHSGRNNSFEVNKGSALAIQYNDVSVLENHHAAMTFLTIQKPTSNIAEALSEQQFKDARKLIIEAIFATDMIKHFQIISNMSSRFDDIPEAPIGSKDSDKLNIASMIVHTGDLANSTRPYEVNAMWSILVNKEFAAQVEDERRLGLPVTEFMVGVEKPEVFYKNEMGFNVYVVKPLWVALDKWLNPHIELQLNNMETNIKLIEAEKVKADEAAAKRDAENAEKQ